uniref:Hydrolase_4 domain-containing protein n=1 Tax=Bursaphelenchus xylophilus TaxID=6326 RepID=A0A1I7RT08_BURXY
MVVNQSMESSTGANVGEPSVYNLSTAVERSPDLIVEDTQDDITSSTCDPEKFHEVFGEKTQPTWLKHADPKQAAFYQLIDVPAESRHEELNPNTWRHKLITMARGFSICFHLCYTLCPPIPSLITKKIAFFPPTSPFYFFRIKNDDGIYVKGNARDAFGKQDVTLELSPLEGEHTSVIEGVRAFSAVTSKNNYIACVRIKCTLKHRPLSLKKKVIIFCQPNSSDLGMFIWKRNTAGLTLAKLADRLGIDVVSFDYSGFGMSTGSASEANVYEDVKAVYEHVRKTDPDKKIFLMGLSLGTAACVHQGMLNPTALAGIILLAPFTSGVRVLMATPNRAKPYKLDSFRSYEKIKRITVPVFIAHGLLDDVIAYDHGVALLRQCQKPVPIQLPREADHTTVFTVSVSKKILNFVAREADNYSLYYDKEGVIKELEQELKKIADGIEHTKAFSVNPSNSQSAASLDDSEDISLLEEEIEKIESNEALSFPEGSNSTSLRVYNHADHVKSQARMPKDLVVTAIKSRFSLAE